MMSCFRDAKELHVWTKFYAVFVSIISLPIIAAIYALKGTGGPPSPSIEMPSISKNLPRYNENNNEDSSTSNDINISNYLNKSRKTSLPRKIKNNYVKDKKKDQSSAKDKQRGGAKDVADNNTINLTEKQMMDLQSAIINEINTFRAEHEAPPLEKSEFLTRQAQKRVNILAKDNKLQEQGEILWTKRTYKLPTAQDICGDWYAERQWYEANQEFPGNSGNFSQMIWKRSNRVGVTVTSNGPQFTVVAIFSPVGNVVGEFLENVSPKL